MPFTALKITAGFILYLIYISVGEPMSRLASQLNFKNKYLPCITFLFKFLCKYKKHNFYDIDYIQTWKQFGSSLSFFFPSLINYQWLCSLRQTLTVLPWLTRNSLCR